MGTRNLATGGGPVHLRELAAAACVERYAAMGPLFGVAWFVIVIGPYLPLSDHKMDYYLTVPVIGLAIWAVGADMLLAARGWYGGSRRWRA